jgi:hypothetical protein
MKKVIAFCITGTFLPLASEAATVLPAGNVSVICSANQVVCSDVVSNGAGTINSLSVSVDNAPSVGTVTTVANSNTSVTLLASNPARKSYTICNTSNKDLWISAGATASNTSFYATVPSAAGTVYSCFKDTVPGYTGAITGVWNASGTNNAVITSFQ